jgi:hypothetical protein
VYQTFNSKGGKQNLSAMDFFKMSKALKIYPAIVSLDILKKIVLKHQEFWSSFPTQMDEETD